MGSNKAEKLHVDHCSQIRQMVGCLKFRCPHSLSLMYWCSVSKSCCLINSLDIPCIEYIHPLYSDFESQRIRLVVSDTPNLKFQ